MGFIGEHDGAIASPYKEIDELANRIPFDENYIILTSENIEKYYLYTPIYF